MNRLLLSSGNYMINTFKLTPYCKNIDKEKQWSHCNIITPNNVIFRNINPENKDILIEIKPVVKNGYEYKDEYFKELYIDNKFVRQLKFDTPIYLDYIPA